MRLAEQGLGDLGPAALGVSIIGWLLASRWVTRTYRWQQSANLGGINVRMGCNIPISVKSLKFWLKDKDVIEEIEEFDRRGDIKTLVWQERNNAIGMKKWLGSPPRISLRYDQKAGILLNITMHAPEAFRSWRRGSDMMTSELLRQTLMTDLDSMSVILHDRLGKNGGK